MVLRYNAAGRNPRLRGNGVFNQTGVKAHAGVIDKELVGPSDAGQASVFVHPHKVVGVEIILSVNLFQFKEHGVVQPSAAHCGRGKIQHARTRSVRKIVELLFVFRENFDFEARQRIADGVVLPFRGSDDAGSAHLGQSIAVDNPGSRTAGAQIIVEALLEFGGNIGAAHEHKLHLGQIDIGHRLVPGIQNGHTGEENANAAFLDCLSVMGVGGAQGQAHHFHAEAQGSMKHIHHRINPGQAQGQEADHFFRRLLEIFICFLRFQCANHERVQSPVRHGNRFVDAADRSRGMHDDGSLSGFHASVSNGSRLIFLQKIRHQKSALKLPEHRHVQLACRLQRRDGIFAAHGAFQ